MVTDKIKLFVAAGRGGLGCRLCESPAARAERKVVWLLSLGIPTLANVWISSRLQS